MSFHQAVADIRARMAANWAATPIAYANEPFAPPEPPSPWVFFEVVEGASMLRGIGKPGERLYIYTGLIQAHVYVPAGSGETLARQYADAIGEIFRAKQFGSTVRTNVPNVDAGGPGSDDGLWWRVTAAIDFDFFYHG